MLNSDPEKLRFLGIDLHSRARRRWMVALTYLAFSAAETWIVKESIPDLQGQWSRYYLAVAVALAVIFLSVFREDGPVKPLLDVKWRAEWRGKHKWLNTPPIELDERELAVRDRAVRRTLELMIFFCFICVLPKNYAYMDMSSMAILQPYLMLAVFGATWPKAIILWNEPDPRKNSDPHLAQQPLT